MKFDRTVRFEKDVHTPTHWRSLDVQSFGDAAQSLVTVLDLYQVLLGAVKYKVTAEVDILGLLHNERIAHDVIHKSLQSVGVGFEECHRIARDVVAASQGPNRHYHTYSHIAYVCHLLGECGRLGSSSHPFESTRVSLFFALFHDIVYDAQSFTNEEQSEAFAARYLTNMAGAWELDSVSELIRLSSIAPFEDELFWGSGQYAQVFDADLAILGSWEEAYDQYAANIRKEFSFAPPQAFAVRRAAILRKILDRKTIYRTDWFRERFEEKARSNLTREIQSLDP